MMRGSLSLRALALAGVATAFLPQAVYAQDDAGVAEDDSNVIVVRAQGRDQSLADVPVAISAVSGELLAKSGTTDIRELNQVAPSLLVSSTGNESNGSARIRGIGTVGDNPGLESSVAVFVDGVYRSRSGNALSELGPIDRIEILRGPQGTLGGRNSSAGMISVYTAPPEFNLSGYGAFSYGNFESIRAEAGINLPIGDTVAARVDGVYFKRDGFYNDVTNGTRINDRDRYLVRAQLLIEPSETLSFRLVGDYSKKDEACCAATFVQADFAPGARVSPGLNSFVRPTDGPALTSTANPIVPVMLALGQNPLGLSQSTFNRNIYPTAGRTYQGETEDFGVSGELNLELGAVNLTAITGYREYSNFQGSDTDYTTLDLLYRTPGQNADAREFKTFTQELRLNGSAFDDRIDWLIGGFYTNEKLQTRDNLRFGEDYGTFASCRIALALVPTFGAGVVNPANQNCLRAGTTGLLGTLGTAINNLSTMSDVGGTGDVYNQKSESYAFFTHNIIHLTDTVDLTLGLRYTNETKKFNATFGNDNVVCGNNRAILAPAIAANNALAQGILGLSCQGNSTAELDGVSLRDQRKEDEFTGTAVLSWKPIDDLLVYGSYSRGYKAGGFNLDRSALANPVLFNANAINVKNLQFDEETVKAYEIGAKYSTREFGLSVAAFRQEFSNFQLNTFNGSVFLVQNVNGCGALIGGSGTDSDASNPTVEGVVQGSCARDNIKPGVIAQGFELEATLNPTRDLGFTVGLTYTNTKYEDDLIGNDTGAALDPALRLLPGDNLSNAPEIVATASASWTPELGSSGARGLVFINVRMTDDYNTGSDLLYGKEQDGYALVNGRIGVTNIADRFAIEGWVQNLFDKQYTQVAFNTPFVAPQQMYSAFLAEPRTYGVTVRGKF